MKTYILSIITLVLNLSTQKSTYASEDCTEIKKVINLIYNLLIIYVFISYSDPVSYKSYSQWCWSDTAITSDLDNESVCIGALGLWWHMLLDGLTWALHGQQNESVGEEDDSAGDYIAKEEKADNIRQSWKLIVGCMPVNAARCPIRLKTVMSPVCQWPQSKHRRVTPNSSHQEVGMWRGEVVTW